MGLHASPSPAQKIPFNIPLYVTARLSLTLTSTSESGLLEEPMCVQATHIAQLDSTYTPKVR